MKYDFFLRITSIFYHIHGASLGLALACIKRAKIICFEKSNMLFLPMPQCLFTFLKVAGYAREEKGDNFLILLVF